MVIEFVWDDAREQKRLISILETAVVILISMNLITSLQATKLTAFAVSAPYLHWS